LVAGLAVATALVGGCSSKHEANDTLPSASETSASPSLEPLGPANFPVPDEARVESDAGAEASARYYLSLTTYSFETLDTAPLRELSSNCEFCTNLATTIDTDATAGHKFVGGAVTVGQDAQVARDGESTEVYVSVSQSALQVVDAAGAQVRGQPAYDVAASVIVEWQERNHSWLVTQVTVN
jgi:hypothetical protein